MAEIWAPEFDSIKGSDQPNGIATLAFGNPFGEREHLRERLPLLQQSNPHPHEQFHFKIPALVS